MKLERQLHTPEAAPAGCLGDPRPTIASVLHQLRTRIAIASLLAAILVVGLGGWSALVPLSGAVIAQGSLIANGHNKKVQHPLGGIVSEILVANGRLVAAGDVLIRLDETQSRARLRVIELELAQLRARRTRLAAERDLAPAPTFDAGMLSTEDERRAASAELRQFETRRAQTQAQKAGLAERIGQLDSEHDGLLVQQKARNTELGLLMTELARTEQLEKKQLVAASRVSALRRDVARLNGEIGQLTAQRAQTRGKISEIRVQIAGLDHALQNEAQAELRTTDDRIDELGQRRLVALDELRRVEIRAPQSGLVHDLAVFTVGGVVAAGEQLMLIVPSGEELEVEARVAATDIDQIRAGQSVRLRFSALNARTTPEAVATVAAVGADLSRDAPSGPSYYAVRARLDRRSVPGVAGLLLPGMPVECFFVTADRTLLSYLTKPFRDHVQRALIED